MTHALCPVCSGCRRPRATHLDGGRPWSRHHGRPDRRALRQRRRAGPAARPRREDRARGTGPRAQAEARPAVRARRARADSHRRASTPTSSASATPTGFSRPSSSVWTSSAICWRGSMPSGARARSSARTPPASRLPRSPRAARTTSAGTGWARTSSTRRATCGCSEIIPTPETDPAVIDGGDRVCRPSARQRRRRRQGHAELHREPHRALRRDGR